MAKNAERPMVGDAGLATHIVDGILDAVERAGYFTGARKMRRLSLQQIVHRDGRVEDVRERLIAWTAEWIERGRAPSNVGRPR